MNELTNCEICALRDDGEFAVSRISWNGDLPSRLLFSPVLERPAPASLAKLDNSYALRSDLDPSWAVRPVELVNYGGRLSLVSEDPGGDFLEKCIDGPMPIPDFLRIAAGMAKALGKLHEKQFIHRDINPANVIVDFAAGEARLAGFGLVSRVPRHRQPPEPPEVIAGTLAYMAPEQTGRMNRSVDSRSDLYSLGVTFYEMIVGGLPFAADDPMEWVHCHIARTPVPPSLRRGEMPEPISAIIMKMLAKASEERYQTAAGVEADLRRCLRALEADGRVESIPLGADDVSDRLLIPEKLYGREKEVEHLLAAFDRVVSQGSVELVLVSGYSGVGKSSVVNELHKALVPPRGLFASGKFDQYMRDVPYATLAQAFEGLIRPLLGSSETQLSQWRKALHDALDQNGLLMVELVPALKHIIGEQPPVPELPPQDAQRRFHLTFRRFIQVFSRPEHPLALFLDDLQWIDLATLDFLEDILSQGDVRHLLLIGAYRDNEVDAIHPLTRKLASIREAGFEVQNIVLSPLGRKDLAHLVGDSLQCGATRAASLTQLIYEKTTGNPFFTIQFISALADEGLLKFSYDEARWTWELEKIDAKGYTDNVVDLMVARLKCLPRKTQDALSRFACVGNAARFEILRMVLEDSDERIHERLWEALRDGLVFRAENSYRFLHDRVQEAAYSLIPAERRAQEHLRIGWLLAENTKTEKLEEGIFDIVNQLNRGAHLIDSSKKRERLAALNLIAGKRAKVSTAYASARNYLGAASSLLEKRHWQLNYMLTFSIECLLAECEVLTAEMSAAERRLAVLSQRARTSHDFAVVTRLQLTLYTTMDRSDRAIEIFLDYLRRHGTNWTPHPAREDVMVEYNRIWSLLGDRQIEDLMHLPLLTDPDTLDMLDVCTEIVHPALFYDENLSSLVVCRMVTLSLERGNCDASCFGYVWFAMFAGPRFDNYKNGFRFGKLGYDLVDKGGFTTYRARTYISFATLTPWAKHVLEGRDLVRRAFNVAYRLGDLTFTAYSWHVLITNYLAAGDPLTEAQREAETGLAFVKKAGFGLVAENCGAQLGLIRTLRGLTSRFGCLDGAEYNESDTERRLASNPVLVLAEFFYWTRKLQARFFAGEVESAVDAAERAQRLLWPAVSQVETGDFRFFAALAHAAAWDSATAGKRQAHCESLRDHYRQIEKWAEHCPANFENRAALVAAEIARIEGRALDAEQLYEKAIHSAHANGFTHYEAVANELAARFYAMRGLATASYAYLRNARICYDHWGAHGKVKQLDERHPRLRNERPSASSAAIGPSFGELDVEAVVKASQALSSEIILPKLIEQLMRIVVEHAGAERGLLILIREGEPRIEAEATIAAGNIEVADRHAAAITPSDLPQSILHYAIRTQERVLLDDASSDNVYSQDEYLRLKRSRSVLCLPIVKQKKLVGALYLENSLSPHVFTPDRVAVLELLASQASISIENAALYTELQIKVGLLQLLPVSAWTLKPDGTPDFVNQVWLEFAGQTLEFVRSHPEAWMTAVHPEDREMAAKIFWEGVHSGQGFAMETRTLRAQDETYRWHLHQAVVLRDSEGKVLKFVGTTTDIDDQKRIGEAFRHAQAELAQVTRVTTMGELAASIAHEVNQPIAGIVINGVACLRWLARVKEDSVNITEARATLERLIRDGKRAGDIVARIRALFKHTEAVKESVDLNDTIREIIVLATSELEKHRVALCLELGDLPPVFGDKIQLQQVILNLILNAIEAVSRINGRPRDLTIRTERVGDREVLATVRDSGVGIDPGSLEKIFTAFHTTKAGGLGMGLSISRTIVENHDGRLWVTGHDGPGASFHFTLPTAR